MLGGLPKAPTEDSPFSSFKRARDRQRYVLGQMLENQFISAEEYAEAMQEPIAIVSKDTPLNHLAAPYFVEHVRRLVQAKYCGTRSLRSRAAHPHHPRHAAAARGRARRAPRARRRRSSLRLPRPRREARRGRARGVPGRHAAPVQRAEGGQARHHRGRARARPPLPRDLRAAVGQRARQVEAVRAARRAARGLRRDRRRQDRSLAAEARQPPRRGRSHPGAHPEDRRHARRGQEPHHRGGSGRAPRPATGHPGRARRRRSRDRLSHGDGRRLRLQPLAVQPRDAGQAPGRLVDQALHLRDGARARLHRGEHSSPTRPVSVKTAAGMWSPHNYKAEYLGPITLRTALQKSINTVSRAPRRRASASTRSSRASAASASPRRSSATRRSRSARPRCRSCEHAYGYATFPAGGLEVTPVLITKIIDADGNVVEENRPPPGRAPRKRRIPADTAYVMVDMMKNVVEHGTGQKAKEIGRPAAGKTGTSNDFKDNWFMAFTRDLRVRRLGRARRLQVDRLRRHRREHRGADLDRVHEGRPPGDAGPRLRSADRRVLRPRHGGKGPAREAGHAGLDPLALQARHPARRSSRAARAQAIRRVSPTTPSDALSDARRSLRKALGLAA